MSTAETVEGVGGSTGVAESVEQGKRLSVAAEGVAVLVDLVGDVTQAVQGDSLAPRS